MTRAMQVAEYLEAKNLYGQTQLQKLLYYSQGWSLAWTGKPLFNDEIQAWKNGPVVHQVWATLPARNGSSVVEQPLTDDQKAIIDAIYDFYSNKGGAVLSEETHNELPWIEARGSTPSNQNSREPLSQTTMLRFFSSQQGNTPTVPALIDYADSGTIAAALKRQSARWREALDALALR